MKAVTPMHRSNGKPSCTEEYQTSGVFPQGDGSFLAITYAQSKYFKTLAGAQRWHARKTK